MRFGTWNVTNMLQKLLGVSGDVGNKQVINIMWPECVRLPKEEGHEYRNFIFLWKHKQ